MPTNQTLGTAGALVPLGIAKEITAGVPVAPSLFYDYVSAQFTPTNKLIPHMGVRNQIDPTLQGAGLFELKGTLEGYVYPDSAGLLLGMAMGSDTVTGAAGDYLHTFKLHAPKNTFTTSIDYGRGVVHQFAGGKVDSFDISNKAGEFLNIKLGVQAITDAPLVSSSLSPTYTSLYPFEFGMNNVATINGVSLPASDFSISLKNNLEPYYATGSGRFVRGMNEKNVEITGQMTVQAESDFLFQVLYGGGSFAPGAGPASVVTGLPVIIGFTHPQFVSGTTPYTLTMTLPNVQFSDAGIDPKRNDILTYTIKFSAASSVQGAQDSLSIAMVNGQATSYVS